MGKRGGKRRHRATQWMEKSTAASEDPVQKKPKLVDSSPTNTLASNDDDGSDGLQVSLQLVGTDSVTPLPPPFSFDVAQERSKVPNDALTYSPSFHHATEPPFPPSQASIVKLWKNLSQNQWKLSKIQEYLWAFIFHSSWNVIGVAPTGSGKTLSYAIPTVLSQSAILVLVPTRELAQQVAKVFTKVCKVSYSSTSFNNNSKSKQQQPRSIVCIHGGANRRQQQQELEAASTTGTAIVVATPGRYLDLTQSTRLIPVFSWIVLDEADQLAKDGDLGPQVDQIITETTKIPSSNTRLVLVSATYPEKSKERFQTWVGKEHVLVQVNHRVHEQQQQPLQPPLATMETTNVSQENRNDTATKNTNNNAGTFSKIPPHLEQVLHVCSEHKKPRKLLHTLQQIYNKYPNQRNRPLGIVFFSKIEKLKYVAKLLEKEGVTGGVELHSQLPSAHLRETHLAQFASGQKPLLLATDVAARGIDIPHVHFVIQYDFPGNLQQYIHRCGRAGRSSQETGTSTTTKPTIYSFFTRNLKPLAMDLIHLLEAHKAWVDPNLRALTMEEDDPKSKKKVNKKKKRQDNNNHKEHDSDEREDDEVDDDFPELVPNRIVLKRASHVSDASSSENESDHETE